MFQVPSTVLHGLPKRSNLLLHIGNAVALVQIPPFDPNARPNPEDYLLVLRDPSGNIVHQDGTSAAIAVVERDTRAAVIASTGEYAGQIKYANNYGLGRGLAYEWNGSAWVLPPIPQLLYAQYSSSATDADTNEKTLASFTVPPLAAGDSVLLRTGWAMTSSANNKTQRVKVGGVNNYSTNFTTSASDVRDHFYRFRAASGANNVVSGYGNNQMYGSASGSIQPYTIDVTAETAWAISGQKASAGESYSLEWFEAFVMGSPARY